ncbi:MAG: hypothetical protein WBS24_04750 [Terriglobales bacterium]
MRCKATNRFALAIAMLACTTLSALAQSSQPQSSPSQSAKSGANQLQMPGTIEAGTSFSVPTSGTGNAILYIVGPGGAVRRDVKLGESVVLGSDDLTKAGRYTAFLVIGNSAEAAGNSTQAQFEVVASPKAAALSFLAKPSRLPVSVLNGVSGVVYVFDIFGNLILQPDSVAFELTDATGHKQVREITSHDGVAWVKMNSAPKAGAASFVASIGAVREKRVVQEVAGDPCTVKMAAQRSGQNVILQTDPLHDCAGNPVPDGTIVTFTETYPEHQSTVDVPLKRGVARTELPEEPSDVISVASGVIMGNEIHGDGKR